MIGLLGQKVGMTRIFSEDGTVTPVTVVKCVPNEVTQIKTKEKDGYTAVVLGFEKLKKPTKTRKFRRLKEFKIEESEVENYKKGDVVNLDVLLEVEFLEVCGKSKGKGFQGGIKRWNFSRGPETHGSHHHRRTGSIGACAAPGRVAKGKKMPGRMGVDQVTLKKVKVVKVDPEKNIVCLKGAVPGPNGGIVSLTTK